MYSDSEDDRMCSDGSDAAPDLDLLPAVLRRPAIANHVAHDRVTVETMDREDHTFCGMMFDVRCTDELPVEWLEVTSVAVRGRLGPMTVWTTPSSHQDKWQSSAAWTKVYERSHAPSHEDLVALDLDAPIRLAAGESCGLFVHSARHGDTAVVYDNMRPAATRSGRRLFTILPGRASLDNVPFGANGMWGEGWRTRREFVGRIAVGVCWRLWNPEVHSLFPLSFRRAARCLLLCATKPDCQLHFLSDAVILYVLNMCRWDWFEEPALEEGERAEADSPSSVYSGTDDSSEWDY